MSIKSPSTSLPESELFFPVRAESVSSAGRSIHIKATPEQLESVAKRLDIVAIKELTADIKLELQNGGHILYISGTFSAEVTQECVVTSEPVSSHVEDSFEAWYADHDKAIPFIRAKHQVQSIIEGDEIQMLDEKEDPEPLIDGQVDLGEVVIQFLSLAINPYPRKEGVQAAAEVTVIAGNEKKAAPSLRPNPFAALKNWRPKD